MQIGSLCCSYSLSKMLSNLVTLVTSATSLKPKQFEIKSTWSLCRCLPAEVQRSQKKQTSFKPGRHALQVFHHRRTRVIAVLYTFDPPGKRCCDQTISFLMTSPTNTIRTNGGCWILTLYIAVVGPMLGVLPSFTVGTGATFASEIRLDDWPLGQLQELAPFGRT